MREQVELLKHHADVAPDLVDVPEVVRHFHAVNDDAAALMLLQTVDAADQGRLARSGRAANDNALAARDLEVDVLERVEGAVPFVHAGHLDGSLASVAHSTSRECSVHKRRSTNSE